jgi:CBS-domain-containing membrane protein
MAMLTDRDVCMAALTQGRTLGEIRVNSAMSGSLHVVRVRDPLAEAERKMQEFQVRRLPVVGVDGRLVGLLSMNDIAREAARERPHRPRAVTSDDVAATLASVCRPRVCLIDGEGKTAAQPGAARLVQSGAAAV